jgi:hypothetical protein
VRRGKCEAVVDLLEDMHPMFSAEERFREVYLVFP